MRKQCIIGRDLRNAWAELLGRYGWLERKFYGSWIPGKRCKLDGFPAIFSNNAEPSVNQWIVDNAGLWNLSRIKINLLINATMPTPVGVVEFGPFLRIDMMMNSDHMIWLIWFYWQIRIILILRCFTSFLYGKIAFFPTYSPMQRVLMQHPR